MATRKRNSATGVGTKRNIIEEDLLQQVNRPLPPGQPTLDAPSDAHLPRRAPELLPAIFGDVEVAVGTELSQKGFLEGFCVLRDADLKLRSAFASALTPAFNEYLKGAGKLTLEGKKELAKRCSSLLAALHLSIAIPENPRGHAGLPAHLAVSTNSSHPEGYFRLISTKRMGRERRFILTFSPHEEIRRLELIPGPTPIRKAKFA